MPRGMQQWQTPTIDSEVCVWWRSEERERLCTTVDNVAALVPVTCETIASSTFDLKYIGFSRNPKMKCIQDMEEFSFLVRAWTCVHRLLTNDKSLILHYIIFHMNHFPFLPSWTNGMVIIIIQTLALDTFHLSLFEITERAQKCLQLSNACKRSISLLWVLFNHEQQSQR